MEEEEDFEGRQSSEEDDGSSSGSESDHYSTDASAEEMNTKKQYDINFDEQMFAARLFPVSAYREVRAVPTLFES